jgi:hypothetical protein
MVNCVEAFILSKKITDQALF